jgi:hypothetical protein
MFPNIERPRKWRTKLSVFLAPIQILARFKTRFDWIFPNVIPQILELLGAPHQVIEWFRLPKWSRSFEFRVDQCRRISQPARQLGSQGGWRTKLNQQMDMIGHHDKAIEIVTLLMKVQYGTCNDLSQLWPSEHALAMTFVERIEPPLFPQLEKLLTQF